MNTRTQRRSEDDNDRRKRSTDDSSISEQPYAMKAYVSGETNFTITQGTLTTAMKYLLFTFKLQWSIHIVIHRANRVVSSLAKGTQLTIVYH